MPGLSYNLNERRMAFPADAPEDCYAYDGCSLSLLAPPANNCHYVVCYGEQSSMECGTYRQRRLRAQEEQMNLRGTGRQEARLKKAEQAITGILGDDTLQPVRQNKAKAERAS
jgi:hypothetical protein